MDVWTVTVDGSCRGVFRGVDAAVQLRDTWNEVYNGNGYDQTRHDVTTLSPGTIDRWSRKGSRDVYIELRPLPVT